MNEYLVIGAITLFAWAGLLYLRVPSSVAFLSLLIGQLLTVEASDNLYSFLGSLLNVPDTSYIQIFLLLLPLILTLAFMRNRVPKSKIAIEFLPTLFITALTLVLLSPHLPALSDLLQSVTNDQIDTYKSIIVIAASVSGLLSAWLSYPKRTGGEAKHA